MSDRPEDTVPSEEGAASIETSNDATTVSSSRKNITRTNNNNAPPPGGGTATTIRPAPVPGFPHTTPPSQVTFEGDTASAETLSTTASSSSLAPTHRSPPSPAPSQASSEVSFLHSIWIFKLSLLLQ